MRPRQQDLATLRLAAQRAVGIGTLLLLVSCGRQAPNGPALEGAYSARTLAAAAAPNGALFPLQIGNHWRAVADDYYRTEPLNGPPYNEVRIHTDYARSLIGTEVLFDRPYVVMEETWTQNNPFTGEPRTGSYWIRYRQDASGLYEADVAATTPPTLDTRNEATTTPSAGTSAMSRMLALSASLASSIPEEQRSAFQAAWDKVHARAELVRSVFRKSSPTSNLGNLPNGLLPGEITRLRYPLRPGSKWEIRPDPLFSSEVEAIEHLSLPAGPFPAYRIRIDNEALGPADVVHLWMGRSGQLAVRFHFEAEATDSQGNVIGRVIDDYNEVLHEVSLVVP